MTVSIWAALEHSSRRVSSDCRGGSCSTESPSLISRRISSNPRLILKRYYIISKTSSSSSIHALPPRGNPTYAFVILKGDRSVLGVREMRNEELHNF